jgi:hypothetical protein
MNRDFHLALLAGRRDFEAGRFHAAHERKRKKKPGNRLAG